MEVKDKPQEAKEEKDGGAKVGPRENPREDSEEVAKERKARGHMDLRQRQDSRTGGEINGSRMMMQVSETVHQSRGIGHRSM